MPIVSSTSLQAADAASLLCCLGRFEHRIPLGVVVEPLEYVNSFPLNKSADCFCFRLDESLRPISLGPVNAEKGLFIYAPWEKRKLMMQRKVIQWVKGEVRKCYPN